MGIPERTQKWVGPWDGIWLKSFVMVYIYYVGWGGMDGFYSFEWILESKYWLSLISVQSRGSNVTEVC